MNKVLIIHIGDYNGEVIGKEFDEKYEFIRFIEREQKNTKPNSPNTYIVDFEDEDNFVDLLLSLMPLGDIIISSCVNLKESDDTICGINLLLKKIFLAVKYLYMPVMRKRRGKIWISESQVIYHGEDPNFAEPLIAALRGGVKALTKVAALELAKKKININYIEGNMQENCLKIEKIIQWSSKRSHLYLTAQDLKI